MSVDSDGNFYVLKRDGETLTWTKISKSTLKQEKFNLPEGHFRSEKMETRVNSDGIFVRTGTGPWKSIKLPSALNPSLYKTAMVDGEGNYYLVGKDGKVSFLDTRTQTLLPSKELSRLGLPNKVKKIVPIPDGSGALIMADDRSLHLLQPKSKTKGSIDVGIVQLVQPGYVDTVASAGRNSYYELATGERGIITNYKTLIEQISNALPETRTTKEKKKSSAPSENICQATHGRD